MHTTDRLVPLCFRHAGPAGVRSGAWFALPLLLLLLTAPFASRADSVVVFNEIMYHPATNEAVMEWVELHNQMAVDVDLSRWSIDGGIQYQFAEGTVIPGQGYLVVAVSPDTLRAATGLTNVFGPFVGRLANSGEKLELRNSNQRLMDSVTYGTDGDWPVGADGGGVSLAKRDEDAASDVAANWTVSALAGGTPGRRNFALTPFEVASTTPVLMNGTWKFEASGNDPDPAWCELPFDDSGWSSGTALFQAGTITLPVGDPQAVPTLFSTGIDTNGTVLAPGSADPHYLLTQSAQSVPPPPSIAATVIQNHPAWLANDAQSSWLGPVNPGTADVAAGPYTYRTTFSLDGFNATSAMLSMAVGADNRLNDVLLNGVSKGISFAGFSVLSGSFTITNGFVPGVNTLDFLSANDGTTPNPAGFRAKLSGTARRLFVANSTLPAGRTNYYFRTRFTVPGSPRSASLQLRTVVADGAVVYLNGAEVFRWNMPTGLVNAATLALSNVTSPACLGPFILPNKALVTGTNVLAVEIHPFSGGANHLLFGADLSLTTTNVLVPPAVTLALNEVSPAAVDGSFWLELINYGSTDLDLANCVLARRGPGSAGDYVLPPRTLGAGELVQITQAAMGFGANAGDRLFLCSPDYGSVLDAVVVRAEPHARWPDGTGNWCYPTSLTPGTSNQVAFHNEVVINEIMYHGPVLPPSAGAYGTNILISITNLWRYSAAGVDLGSGWNMRGFDDSSWPISQALFFSTPAVLPEQKNTELPLNAAGGAPIITYYFRTPFNYPGAVGSAQLTLHPMVDDGAVYYLNGVEIYRQNMPQGDISYTNLARSGVATPAYAGPFTVQVTNLLAGTNLLAVEVHQFTTNPIGADMAFGVELSTGLVMPPLPARDSPEAWVELFNRGSDPVDLGNWVLSGGIQFGFVPGTVIQPGGYLVVAKDVGYMQTNYPGITVLGPLTGKLSHRDDLVVLIDPAGNVANQVHYFDGGRWPEYADGGGSSLELRDPWADNSKPEAWAASNESGRCYWSNYSYRAVSANVLGPTQWKEFVMGLLDAGECLIDDLHVVESPDTAPVEMLQNGSFENGLTAWRALGDHNRSRVEVDPDNPANHVLHLIATGPTEHLHNHLETTFAGGRAAVDGRIYQVSFRAKWLAGNNRLNTRLYFNRVAKTTVLPMASRHGTPGAPNSVYATNIGPAFAAFSHSPIVPQPNAPVTVTLSAGDPQGVQAVNLRWAVNGGSWQTTPMLPQGAAASPGYSNYSAVIPGQAAGALVQFYAQATDGQGAISTFPARGANSRALYKVDDGKPLMSRLHRIRLLMTPADADFLHAHTNVMSDDHIGLTVVYDERQVFYDAGVHLQSSERGRDDPSRVGFTVKFSPDQLFRGVQGGFTLDRSGGYSGLGGKHDEILLWHAVNHAGGLLGLECDLVQVLAPHADQDGTGMLRMSDFNGDYFDNQFAHGGDGNRYKLELIYYPTTTVTGDPQALKLPQPDDVLNVDIQNWGTDPENYRWIFIQENNADFDDYSQLIALNQTFSLAGTNLASQAAQRMDVDEWLRTLAFKTFTGDVDTYTAGLNHNWKIYFRPEDGKALGLLWDEDYTFVQSVTTDFPGSSSPNTYRLVTLPDNYRRYYNHLLDLMTTTINSSHLSPWAARYAGLVGQDWSGVVNYMQQRANFIRSRMPLTTPFAITNNGGRAFATTNNLLVLAGSAPLTVKDIAVNGVLYPITWISLTNWTLTVPLLAYTNFLVARGIDNYGNLLSNAVASITVTNLGAPAPKPVVVNEWVADNAGPGGFADPLDGRFQDWIELYNPNNFSVNLSGYYLTDTLSDPAKWQIPTNTVIAPLGFLLVWADGETNQNGLSTSGDLHANFQLSRTGEAIGLYAPDLTPQHAFVFGQQYQNVSQGLYPDGNTNAVFFMTNWTPRASNRLGVPPSPQMSGVVLQTNGVITFEATVIPGRTYRVEYKDDLAAPFWTPLGVTVAATGATVGITNNLATQPQRFYRLVLLQ